MAGIALVWRSRAFLLRETPIMILATVVALFGFSVLVDMIDAGGAGQYLLEDGPKLLGLMGWATFLALTALRAIDRATDPPAGGPGETSDSRGTATRGRA